MIYIYLNIILHLKKLFSFSLIIFFVTYSVQAQTNTFVLETGAEHLEPAGNNEFYFFGSGQVSRMDHMGITIWSKQMNLNGYISTMDRSPGGNLFFLGMNSNSNIGEPVVICTDSLANIIWAKKYRIDGWSVLNYDMNVEATVDGGAMIVGTMDTVSGNESNFLLRVDGSGNPLWCKSIESNDKIYPHFVVEDTAGEYFFSGHSYVTIGPPVHFFFKTDNAGNLYWTQLIYNHASVSSQPLIDGSDYIVPINSVASNSSGQFGLFRIGNDGSLKTSAGVTETVSGYVKDIARVQGGFVLTASSHSFDVSGDMVLIKVDFLFNYEWARAYDMPAAYSAETASSVIESGGGLIMAGSKVIKTDSVGATSCIDSPVVYQYNRTVLNGTPQPSTHIMINRTVLDSAVTVTTSIANVSAPYYCYTGAEEISETPAISIYPNPSAGSFNIGLGDDSSAMLVTIYDILGKKVRSLDVKGKIKIEVTGLQQGIYFAHIGSGEKILAVKKIIVQ